jgi:hypothetical protein
MEGSYYGNNSIVKGYNGSRFGGLESRGEMSARTSNYGVDSQNKYKISEVVLVNDVSNRSNKTGGDGAYNCQIG